ncbi:MAG: hypothetical protein IT329_24360 [Caldilineaceae bacterium]|nr:hypothetical protein [Caldilineaceae bacterium]
MAKKKDSSILGLPPLVSSLPNVANAGLVPYTGSSALTPRETTILSNLHEDKVLIAAFGNKARYGLEEMNELKWFAAADVWGTMQEIEEIRQEARGTDCGAAMDEFCTYMVTLSARHTLGVVEVSSAKIAEVVSESVLPPPPPPPPPRKGFLARLVGG